MRFFMNKNVILQNKRSDAVWNNFAAAGTPAFTTKDIWTPFASTTSFITIVPATLATDFDGFFIVPKKQIVITASKALGWS